MQFSRKLRRFDNWRILLEETTGWKLTETRQFCKTQCQTFVSWQLFEPCGEPYGLPFEEWDDLTDFLLQNNNVRQAIKKDFQASKI